jgi:hypothetical protein
MMLLGMLKHFRPLLHDLSLVSKFSRGGVSAQQRIKEYELSLHSVGSEDKLKQRSSLRF